MSASTKTFVNGSTPQCEDDDLNGILAENNNLILGSGQALNTADNQQTNRAVSIYAAGGDFYTDSGSGTAYVLSVVGAKVAPPVYFDGQRIRFIVNTTNTGAATINVDGVGVVNLYLDGAVLGGGELQAGDYAEATYGSSRFNLDKNTRLYPPTEVTNFTTAQNVTISDEAAAASNFDLIASIANSVWESVGPTASGADNEWAALNDVPDTAKKIIVKVDVSVNSTGVVASHSTSLDVRGRAFGSSLTDANRTRIGKAVASGHVSSTLGSYGVKGSDVSEVFLPINGDGKFELFRTVVNLVSSGTATTFEFADIYLVGWVE